MFFIGKLLNFKLNALGLMVLFVSGGVWGQSDRYWSGGSSSSDDIDQTSNWFGGVSPSSNDNLYFNNSVSARRNAYSNYGAGSNFNFLITYTGSKWIKFRK